MIREGLPVLHDRGHSLATIVHEWPDTLALVPLGPVTERHTLVISRIHVPDVATDPDITAVTVSRAVVPMQADSHASGLPPRSHLVPRVAGDGLALPWSAVGATPN